MKPARLSHSEEEMQWLRRHLAAEAAAGHKQAVMWILRMIGLGEGRHYTEPQLHHAAKKMIEEAKEIT
jgi:hypothetical protein